MTRTVFDCARVPHKTCSVQIIGDRDASKMLVKDYRAPWDRELKAVLPKM